MTTIRVKKTQFTGLSKLFSREPDGLAAIIRGMLYDNASLKLQISGVKDFIDNTTGTPAPTLLALPLVAIDATSAGGAQVTALNASLVKLQNAGKVATNTLNEARLILGLPLVVSASGTQVTADTLPALDLTSTAGVGTAAATFVSALASFKIVASNLQALVNGANGVLASLGAPVPMFRAALESYPSVGGVTLAAIPVTVAVAAGPGAVSKADADAFLAHAANDFAALAFAWNAVLDQGAGAGAGPLRVVAV